MRFVKDNIWGNIVCSDIEFEIFSFPLFNRLHYILQNSMAYLVYPSNKTSRFIHSLGVCYLAGEIYSNGLKNANIEIVNSFLKSKKTFLTGAKNDIVELIDRVIGIEADRYKEKFINDNGIKFELLNNYIYEFLGNCFSNYYSINSSRNISSDLSFIKAILFQTTRLFALFHDYGHLPFSHLFEFAIEDFFDDISESEKNNEFGKKLKNVINKDDDIHEFIGKKFTILTLRNLQNKISFDDKEKEIAYKIIYELIIYILKEMHKGKDSELYSLYEIISSDLDADRIDYTIRDLNASGLNRQFDADRIIKLFKLSENKDDGVLDKFKFYPSIQSLYDIDGLFKDRENLYKMVLNHHKVKKFDYILQKLIKLILIEDLNNAANKNRSNISIDDTRDFFNILFELYEMERIEKQPKLIERIIYKFTQLTDYWLQNILRFYLLKTQLSFYDNEKIKKLGSELLNGTKNFTSLYKREYEYEEFIKKIFKEIENYSEREREIFDLFRETNWSNRIEEKYDLNILIANTKLPKTPKRLKLINNKSNEIINYKVKMSIFKTKFFIYLNEFGKKIDIQQEIVKSIKEGLDV
jgi:HD superfamily phosphohydrolase